ncbi:MAG TPA: hypothetical protein VLT86_09015 [Vicinamibacterales bacterium]|nr:hypothetical protein [Vicinamibacterales bacterium]
MGRLLTPAIAAALVLLPSLAAAQPPGQHRGMFLYGLSAGVGERTTSGTLQSSALPVTAGQPPSSQTVGVLDLSGGMTVANRLAILALFEQAGGASTDTAKWGTLGFHGVVRAWVGPRVWVEGGFGSFDLAFRPPNQTGTVGVVRFWAASPEVAIGGAIFQSQHVAIGLLARYTTATLEGLRVNHFSVQVELSGRQ